MECAVNGRRHLGPPWPPRLQLLSRPCGSSSAPGAEEASPHDAWRQEPVERFSMERDMCRGKDQKRMNRGSSVTRVLTCRRRPHSPGDVLLTFEMEMCFLSWWKEPLLLTCCPGRQLVEKYNQEEASSGKQELRLLAPKRMVNLDSWNIVMFEGAQPKRSHIPIAHLI